MKVNIDQVNTKEAAELLGISVQTLYKLCRENKIEYFDISDPESRRPRYMFNRSEIERYVRQNVLGKKFAAEALKRRISKEVVADEYEENLRLKEENQKLRENYEDLKRRMKLLFVEFDQYFKEG